MKLLFSFCLGLALFAPLPAMAENSPLPASCAPGAILRDITFQVDIKIAFGEKDDDEKLSPYIELAAVEKSITGLKESDIIVLPCREVVVVIDYPLKDEFEFPLMAPSEAGFSRAELVRQIGALYQRIYREEAESTSVAVIPPEERKTMLNRNQTNGKYGIWGHDLKDLGFHTISPEVRNGVVQLWLGIDS